MILISLLRPVGNGKSECLNNATHRTHDLAYFRIQLGSEYNHLEFFLCEQCLKLLLSKSLASLVSLDTWRGAQSDFFDLVDDTSHSTD